MANQTVNKTIHIGVSNKNSHLSFEPALVIAGHVFKIILEKYWGDTNRVTQDPQSGSLTI